MTALDSGSDGDRLAVGTEDGGVIEYAVPGGEKLREHKLSGAVTSLAIKPLWLVAAAGRSVQIIPPEGGGEGDRAGARRGDRAGRHLGRRPADRGLRAKSGVASCLGGRRRRRIRARLALDEKAGGEVVSLGFSPGGEALAVGDQDGGIRLWDTPSGAARPPIMAGRGRVRHVAVAPMSRHYCK